MTSNTAINGASITLNHLQKYQMMSQTMGQGWMHGNSRRPMELMNRSGQNFHNSTGMKQVNN